VIFDISCEYPFLLADVFCDEGTDAMIILESKASNWEEFYKSVVKPKKYENDERVKKAFEKIFNLERVTFLTEEIVRLPTYADVLDDIARYVKANSEKPLYVEVLRRLATFVKIYMKENNLTEGDKINRDFVIKLSEEASSLASTPGIWSKSEVYGWLTTRSLLLEILETGEAQMKREGLTVEELINSIEDSPLRLICVSISEAEVIKRLAIDVTNTILLRRKETFKTTPQILFVFDEAQEFVPAPTGVRGIDKTCSERIEKLLRQGRKYGLGGCIATQRVAHLNTSVLQQLHTNFVSTLPRVYDRSTVSQHFNIDREIVDKTLGFVPGEWLLSSYVATGISNVPIFIKAKNSEDVIEEFLKSLKETGG
jgi:PII-like signaling protein